MGDIWTSFVRDELTDAFKTYSHLQEIGLPGMLHIAPSLLDQEFSSMFIASPPAASTPPYDLPT